MTEMQKPFTGKNSQAFIEMPLLDILKIIKALSQEKGIENRKYRSCRLLISAELDMSPAKEHHVHGTPLRPSE